MPRFESADNTHRIQNTLMFSFALIRLVGSLRTQTSGEKRYLNLSNTLPTCQVQMKADLKCSRYRKISSLIALASKSLTLAISFCFFLILKIF